MDLSTNRGNFLVVNTLKSRFPNIFKPPQVAHVHELIAATIGFGNYQKFTTINKYFNGLIISFISDSEVTSSEYLYLSMLLAYTISYSTTYPINIGADYSEHQRDRMAQILVKKHLIDYNSTHCTPLPANFFQLPWKPEEDDNEFVVLDE